MSGLRLDANILRELLQSIPARKEEDYTIMTYTQICHLPDHYQIYDEPDELQSEMGFQESTNPNRRKWAHIKNQKNSATIFICCSDDPYDKIRYPTSVEIDGHITVKGQKKAKMIKDFKYLISKERYEEIKIKREEERAIAIKDFESKIDTVDLKAHIKKWTIGYLKESGFYQLESGIINISALAESAYPDMLTQIFNWYYATQDKTWDDILNSDDQSIEIGLEYNFFYDYYPMLNRFSQIVNELSNSHLTLRPRLSDHGKLSIKYNWYLVKYAKLRCPKMDIKLKYW
jgi:hypothetical protein